MNGKERILRALSCQQPDRVPVIEAIDLPALKKLARLLQIDVPRSVEPGSHAARSFENAELLCLVAEKMELDGLRITNSDPAFAQMLPGEARQDRYGRTFVRKDGRLWQTAGPIKTEADLDGYEMASKIKAEDYDEIGYIVDRVGKEKALFLRLNDPVHLGWTLRGGMSNLMADFVLNPSLVHGLMRVATDYIKAVITMTAAMNVEFFNMAGDIADERTTLMSPRHYRQFVKPYQKEIVELVHGLGLKVMKHTDGNVSTILDDFVEVGFDGFHPVQPQCMDIGEVKQRLAGRLCVIGNIDCRFLLPFGSPDEVVESVKDTIAKAAPGGGYILCSSNSLHDYCKAENFVAMVDAAHQYGVYQ
ncbi:MAG: hypothetical protein HY675_13710 [Chloroflexi bacterium]|nr:hypothetical protein [Chloroflexota bacterium]